MRYALRNIVRLKTRSFLTFAIAFAILFLSMFGILTVRLCEDNRERFFGPLDGAYHVTDGTFLPFLSYEAAEYLERNAGAITKISAVMERSVSFSDMEYIGKNDYRRDTFGWERAYLPIGTTQTAYHEGFLLCAVTSMDILKEVYGIDAAPMPVDTVVYEKFLYDSGFIALQHLGYAKRLFAYVHDVAGQGELSEAQKKAYALCWQDTEALRAKFDEVDQWTKERYDKIRLPVDDQNQRIKYYRELNQREKQLRSSGDALNKAFGSPLELKWTQGANNWYLKGSVINEVYVNFQ